VKSAEHRFNPLVNDCATTGNLGIARNAGICEVLAFMAIRLSRRGLRGIMFTRVQRMTRRLVVIEGAELEFGAEATMADPEGNLIDEELAELKNPQIEDEDFDIETGPDESLALPSGMPDGDIEDDSGFLEEVVEDDDPVLTMEDGTRVGTGALG
jgi:hypothetical protein